MASIVLNNNFILYLSKSEVNKDKIIFKIKDPLNIFFEGTSYFDLIQDLFEKDMAITPEQFFEYLKNNHPFITERKKENEIILTIKKQKTIEIILKDINDKTPKIKNNSEILNHLEIELDNDTNLILKNSMMKQNCINILYLNKITNEMYKIHYEPDEIQDFYQCLKEKIPTTEKGDNEEEIKLNINYKNQNLTIILKKISLIYLSQLYNQVILFNRLINKDETSEMKKKYYEKIEEMKQKNEELYKKNKELKEEIDKEKMKNDEIVRLYLENRLKYEEALKKNNEIKKLSFDI